MNGYLEMPPERRRLLCQQAQAELNLPETSLEKDFWVCWILQELFGLSEWGAGLTFKGGTSLSKCWGLINRFSEDIDIVIDKHFLGLGGEDSPEKAPSKKQRRKRLDAMKETAQKEIRGNLMPALAARLDASLAGADTWELVLAPEEEDRDRQTLLFRYPTALPAAHDYVRRLVKIELGARSDNEPLANAEVCPYLHEAFPDALDPARFP